MARVMDSNISFGQASLVVTADNSGGRHDGGVTWMSPINLPNAPQWGTLDVDTNGNLFIGGQEADQFRCLRPTNAQIGNQTPRFDRMLR